MVQVHSGPSFGVIAQLVERQLCKLDVRSSSLLSSRKHRPGATRYPTEDIGNIEISAWKLTKQSSIQSDLKHQENRWIRAAHAAERELNRWKQELSEGMHAGDA